MENKPLPSPTSYMLLFHNTGPETIEHLSLAQKEQLTRQWNEWYDGLAATGKVQHGQPLAPRGRVVSGVGGASVIDGPYAEAKEAIGGYFLLHVADIDEATEIAKMCPSLPFGIRVEVRPIAEISPVLEGVRGRPPSSALMS